MIYMSSKYNKDLVVIYTKTTYVLSLFLINTTGVDSGSQEGDVPL